MEQPQANGTPAAVTMGDPAASTSTPPPPDGNGKGSASSPPTPLYDETAPARRVPLYRQNKSILSTASDKRRTYKKTSVVHFPKESVATIILESSDEELYTRSRADEADLDDFVATHYDYQDSLLIKLQPGDAFSAHADLCVERDAGDVLYGTVSELRHKLRLGRRAQVKRFLRANEWPATHRVRSELWRELCHDRDHGGRAAVFHETLDRLQAAGLTECQSVRPPACSVTSGAIVAHYRLSDGGRRALLAVLAVVEHVRPDFTCIPILYPLTAALLHYMDEESAFCCVLQLLERRAAFLIQTDIGAAASRRTVWKLAKKYKTDAFKYMRKLTRCSDDTELVEVFAQWKAWLFADLPFEHTVRVLDCFLFEGQKVLFRCALAALHSWHRRRKADGTLKAAGVMSAQQVADDIRLHCRTINVTPEKLMRTAFSVRNLKMSSIHKAQKDSELQRRLNDEAEKMQRVSGYNLAKASMSLNAGLVEALGGLDGVDAAMALAVQSWLPARVTLLEPVRLFSLDTHGTSFVKLWQCVQRYEPTLWMWRTANGYLFGAYCPAAWRTRNERHKQGMTYFGNGQAFVFRLLCPDDIGGQSKPTRYQWVGADNVRKTGHSEELFQAGGNAWLKIGGGGGDAVSVADDLTRVSAGRCDTFDNPPLAGQSGIFDVQQMHVFGFTENGELEEEE